MNRNAYSEELLSVKTLALFVLLTLVFLGLFGLNLLHNGWNGWAIAILCISIFFLFYVFNYRMLKISLTPETLKLSFGIITWAIALSNIEACYTDPTSLWRIGGAGIHFTWIHGKYRAFWNFLEYPRVVITLKKKKGLVQEIAFSTSQPERVMEIIRSDLG